MTTRRKTTNASTNPDAPSLSDLLQGSGSAERVSYCDVDPNTLRRVIYAVSELGGMVTCWVDSNNSRISVSLRVGSEKRSYDFESGEQFNATIEQVISRLTPGLVALKRKPPPPLESK